jgi:1,4-dihydroxy-2-naphthoyl-CoA hydrolase
MEMSGRTGMPEDYTPVVPFDRCFDAQYGLEIVSEDVEGEGLSRGRVAIGAQHLDQNGIVHGGVFASAAEALASRGTAFAVIPHGRMAMGASNDTTRLEPVSGGAVHFEARVLSRADDMWLWTIEARDDAGRLCAHSRVSVAVRSTPA